MPATHCIINRILKEKANSEGLRSRNSVLPIIWTEQFKSSFTGQTHVPLGLNRRDYT